MPNPWLNELKSMAAMNYFLILTWVRLFLQNYYPSLLLGIKCNKTNVTHVKTLYRLWFEMNYFDSSRKNQTNFFKWKSIVEMSDFFKFIGPSGQKITRIGNTAKYAGPGVRQNFLFVYFVLHRKSEMQLVWRNNHG